MYRLLTILLAGTLAFSAVAQAGAAQTASIRVDGRIALASLTSLCDAHLRSTLDDLDLLAASPEARSAQWKQVEPALRALSSDLPLANAVWFAQRNGTYWTVAGGRQSGSLVDRPYFAQLLRGNRVVGALVASRSTGTPVAVVAVPILDARGSMAGILGVSIDLARLSASIKREMDVTPDALFFSLDAHGIVGISATPGFIMSDAMSVGPEFHVASKQMLNAREGSVAYALNGVKRTVIYRTSPLTGWRYAFGTIQP